MTAISSESFTLTESQGVSVYRSPLLLAHGLTHAFTTRQGGVSQAPYDSLNLQFPPRGTGQLPAEPPPEPDKIANILENRRRLALALGINPHNFVTTRQVHGSRIATVTQRDRGKGALDANTAILNSDGLITDQVDVPLLLFFADCVPLILYDPTKSALGIIHAGWRGTALAIAREAIAAMEKHYHCDPANILAAIGPCIGPDVYATSAEARDRLMLQCPNPEAVFRVDDGQLFANLRELNRQQLVSAGLKSEHIDVSHLCTYSNPDRFYSYRRDKEATGRLAAVAYLSSP